MDIKNIIKEVQSLDIVLPSDNVFMQRFEKFLENLISLFEIEDEKYLIYYLKQYYIIRYNSYIDSHYHTIRHMMAVANLLAECPFKTKSEKKLGFTAGMFHDYKHSLGKLPDTYNVSVAISNMVLSPKIFGDLSPEDFTVICDALYCTVFPFRIEPKNDVEKYLRDADLYMSFLEDGEHFASGLQKEINIKLPDVKVNLGTMNDFVKSNVIYTEYFKELMGV